jgi:hypothetical protein
MPAASGPRLRFDRSYSWRHFLGRLPIGSGARATSRPGAHPGARENADERTLAQGRTLFLNRRIQCHALPEVARFDASRLPAIVSKMSGQANLSPKQHEAVLKYLLTVRSQSL